MSEASAPKEAQPSAKEAPKLRKRVGPKEVKGFYYHAAEYQRQKQKERKTAHRILRGVVEPFAIHIRAARLKMAARKYGGGGSAVLDSQFVRQSLDGFRGSKLTDAIKKEFKIKAQLHKVVGKYEVNREDEEKIRQAVEEMFGRQGDMSAEELQALEKRSGLSAGDVKDLKTIATENKGAYQTVDQFKGKLMTDAIYGGLSKDQQVQARKLFHATWTNTLLTGANYIKSAALVAFLASNPVGWGVTAAYTLGSAGLSAAVRGTRLWKEGQTHFISKARGIDVAHKVRGIERLLGVDWDEDPAKRGRQMARAIGAGALLALGARFAPAILEHLNEGVHAVGTDVHNLLDHAGPPKTGMTAGTNEVTKFEPGIPAGDVHEHLNDLKSATTVRFLPDTQHHDWQQLHTIVGHQKLPNGQTVNEIKLSYNGIDDHVPHDQHYIDLMLNNKAAGEHVFIHNDAVLAVNGPDSEKLVEVFKVVNGHVTHAGWMQSGNLATQMGLTQHSIDNFAKITDYANEHWHGTQQASDLQRILFERYGERPVTDGFKTDTNGLYAMRIGGGHFDSKGNFLVGASNHYYDHSLANNSVIDHYAVKAPILPEEAPEFHSAIAGPLQTFDNGEDWLIERFHNSIFSDSFIRHVDEVTDFGLHRLDDDVFAVQERPWLAPLVLTPYAALGYAGYLYGKSRLDKKLTLPRAGFNTAAETALFLANPGLAATALGGYLLARLKGRKKKEEKTAHAKSETNPETGPSGGTSPSDAGNAASSAVPAAAATAATTPVASTIAGSDEEDEVIPAPTLPEAGVEAVNETTPTESLPVTAPIDEAGHLAPPAPVDNPAEETVPVAEEPQPQVPGEVAVPEPAEQETVEAVIPSGSEAELSPQGQAADTVEPSAAADTTSQDTATTVPVETDDVDAATLKDTPAGEDLEKLASKQGVQPSDAPNHGEEFKHLLRNLGAEAILTGLFAPIATRWFGVSEENFKKRVPEFLHTVSKLDGVGPLMMFVNNFKKLQANPEELQSFVSKFSANVGKKVREGASRAEIISAAKTTLKEAGLIAEETAAEAEPVAEAAVALLV